MLIPLALGDIVKKLLKPLAPFLAKVAKGKLTGIGVITGLAGAATTLVAPHVVTDQNIVAILHEIGLILTGIGTIISSFGHGRAVGDGSAHD